MKYKHARSARTTFIDERSVADADVQPSGKVENRFAGDARYSKKKKKEYLNLKIENRLPTHQTNIRIIE